MPEHVISSNNNDSGLLIAIEARLAIVEKGLSDLRDQFALWMKKIQD